jgi:hypothetical protein
MHLWRKAIALPVERNSVSLSDDYLHILFLPSEGISFLDEFLFSVFRELMNRSSPALTGVPSSFE